jgi:hypothetical protein
MDESEILKARAEKPFDLEERALLFAQRVRKLIRALPRDVCNIEDARQLARASASVGANYIEANESMSRKDFVAKGQDRPTRGEREPVFLAADLYRK